MASGERPLDIPQGIFFSDSQLHPSQPRDFRTRSLAERKKSIRDLTAVISISLTGVLLSAGGFLSHVYQRSHAGKPAAVTSHSLRSDPDTLKDPAIASKAFDLNVRLQEVLKIIQPEPFVQPEMREIPDVKPKSAFIESSAVDTDSAPQYDLQEAGKNAQELLKNQRLNLVAVNASVVLETSRGPKSAAILDSRTLITTKDKIFPDDQEVSELLGIKSARRGAPMEYAWKLDNGVSFSIEEHPSANLVVIVFDQDVFSERGAIGVASEFPKVGDPLMLTGSPNGGVRRRIAAHVTEVTDAKHSNADVHIQASQPLSPGMNGGLAMNEEGKFVGVYDTSGKVVLVSPDEISVLSDVAQFYLRDSIPKDVSASTELAQVSAKPQVRHSNMGNISSMRAGNPVYHVANDVARLVAILQTVPNIEEQPLAFDPFMQAPKDEDDTFRPQVPGIQPIENVRDE